MNLTDIRTIKDVMSIYNIHFRKEFGQNFLTNISVVEDIADSCSDTADATVPNINNVAPPNTGSGINEKINPTTGNKPNNTNIPAMKYPT